VDNNLENQNLVNTLRQNTSNIITLSGVSADLVITYARLCGTEIAVITCEGMVSADTVASLIYNGINEKYKNAETTAAADEIFNAIQTDMLISVEKHTAATCGEVLDFAMAGFAVLMVDGVAGATALGAQGYKMRGVEKPVSHLNMRGSNEGFTESMRVNVSLLRRRVKSPTLIFKYLKAGKRSKTDIALCYLSDKAPQKLVDEVMSRLEQLPLDTVLDSGYIQPFLEDSDDSVFSEVGYTDRPDTMIGKISEGRVGVIVDGTPFTLYLPKLFTENFQTMDDYSGMPVYVTLMRWLKYFAFFFTIILPGFYIAVAGFNPELFPPKLLSSLYAAAKTTPYPLMLECLLIYVVYEIMREAGLRLPSVVGHAVSIVGGLVIGDIVVSAGLVGAPVVLIVGLSAITSFVVPDLYDAIVVLRFAFMLAGGLFGLFGLTVVGTVVMLKMCSMRSYGVSYTAPVAPFSLKSMRDMAFRQNWRDMAARSATVQELD